jgi:hypothetical protein
VTRVRLSCEVFWGCCTAAMQPKMHTQLPSAAALQHQGKRPEGTYCFFLTSLVSGLL